MLKRMIKILQVGFTYIGTIVGAGFATGQEILQFFTRYGWIAVLTIMLSSLLLIWLGVKLMLLAHDVKAKSYEDLNKYLFGRRIGEGISWFILVILFGITAVMLAGAGTIFYEHLHLPYQLGLVVTMGLTYLIILKGMDGILAVNSVVVPLMITFSLLVVGMNLHSPTAGNWLHLQGFGPSLSSWVSPVLYAAFNLALAQAVLVPLGSAVPDRTVIRWGGILGGVGIGLMLLGGHFALSAHMPGITRFDIPMGHMIEPLGSGLRYLFLLVIFGEIFTTFIANIFGLMSQLEGRIPLHRNLIIIFLLIFCYLISLIGFKRLLSTLYPLFGLISLLWFLMVIWRKRAIKT